MFVNAIYRRGGARANELTAFLAADFTYAQRSFMAGGRGPLT